MSPREDDGIGLVTLAHDLHGAGFLRVQDDHLRARGGCNILEFILKIDLRLVFVGRPGRVGRPGTIPFFTSILAIVVFSTELPTATY